MIPQAFMFLPKKKACSDRQAAVVLACAEGDTGGQSWVYRKPSAPGSAKFCQHLEFKTLNTVVMNTSAHCLKPS